jgi:hypothetical protein
MGLPKSILQLVGYAYALNEGRVLENQGRPYHVDKLQKLHDELVLVKPDLPSETKWHQALEQAAKLFGISLGGRANNFKNLQDLTKQLTDKAVSLEQTGSQRLPDKLRECAKPFLPQLDAEVPPRLITATSAQDFVGELLRLRDQPVAQVDAVADFAPQTSPEALLKHFQRCSQLTSILSQTANWLILNKVVALQDNPGIAAQAKGLLGQIQEALSQDELIVELGDKINQLIVDVNALEPTKPPQPPKPTAGWEAAGRVQSNIEAANRSDLADQLHSAIQAELEKLPESGQLKANVQINFTRKTEQ